MAVVIILLYVALLGAVVIFSDPAKANDPVSGLGIPASVLVWGAVGSLAAILYRFLQAAAPRAV